MKRSPVYMDCGLVSNMTCIPVRSACSCLARRDASRAYGLISQFPDVLPECLRQ